MPTANSTFLVESGKSKGILALRIRLKIRRIHGSRIPFFGKCLATARLEGEKEGALRRRRRAAGSAPLALARAGGLATRGPRPRARARSSVQ